VAVIVISANIVANFSVQINYFLLRELLELDYVVIVEQTVQVPYVSLCSVACPLTGAVWLTV
jgi:hypothetical protein